MLTASTLSYPLKYSLSSKVIYMRKTLLTTFLALSFSHYASAADVYIHDTFSSNSLSHWETFNQTSETVDIREENSSLKITTKNPQKEFKFAGVSKVFEPKKNISMSTVVQGDFSNYSNTYTRAHMSISNKDGTDGITFGVGRDGNRIWNSQVCIINTGCLPARGTYSNMSRLRFSVIKSDDSIKVFINGDLVYSGVTTLDNVEKISLGGGGASASHYFPVYFSEFSLHTGN